MWPYFLLVIIPILYQGKGFVFCIDKQKYSFKNVSMKLFWIILLLLLILRHESIGRDLSTYRIIFQYIAQNDWSIAIGRSAEIGYNFLNKLISVYSDNFRWVIVISALLSCSFISRTYIRYSEDTALTVSLFIIMSNFVLLFSGLRQAIAISFGFLAFEQVRKKNFVRFLASIIVAMLFHTSAFMLIFMYPLYYINLQKKDFLWLTPLLTMVFVFNNQVFGFLTNILALFTKYDGTVEYTGSYMMLVLFIIFAIFSYWVPDESKMDVDTVGLRNFLMFSVVLQMFAPLHSLAMRMNYYYIAFIPLLMPKIIKYSSNRWKQIAYVARNIMIIFFILYFFVNVFQDNVLDTFPYHFFWEDL